MDVPDVVQQHSDKTWDINNKSCILNQWSLSDKYFKLENISQAFKSNIKILFFH